MRRMMIVVLGLVFFPGCTLIAENQRLTARNALLERAVREVRWERETLEREIVRLENELQSRVAAPTRAAAPIEQGARIVVGGVTDADLAPIQRARATDDVAELTGLFESLPRLALGAVAQGDWEYARDHAMYVDRWEAIAAGQPFFGELVEPRVPPVPASPSLEAIGEYHRRLAEAARLAEEKRLEAEDRARAQQRHDEELAAQEAIRAAEAAQHQQTLEVARENAEWSRRAAVAAERAADAAEAAERRRRW